MKKLFTMFFIVILLLSCVVYASAEQFNDVDNSVGQIYLDAINYLSDNRIMSGWPNGNFQPNTNITRAQAVTVLYRLSGETGTYPSTPFSDVSTSSPYYNAICWATYNGITNGTTATTFEPNVDIPKQQLLVMFYRFAASNNCSLTASEDMSIYSDWSTVGNFARTAVQWAYTYAICDNGVATSLISPNTIVTRKDMALYSFNFRHNVEGIVYRRDNYCFKNVRTNFSSGYAGGDEGLYLMSEYDWAAFAGAVNNLGVRGLNNTISDLMQTSWDGSCFGLSVALVLDYYGKIDLNGNFCNNTDSLYDIPKLSSLNNGKHQLVTAPLAQGAQLLSNAESKINFYQLCQYLTPISEWRKRYSPNLILPTLIEGQKHGGIGVFSYTRPDGTGHAINVYGRPTLYNSNTYHIPIYNSNNLNWDGYIEIVCNNGGYEGKIVNIDPDNSANNYEEEFVRCSYQNSIDIFINNGLDIDSEYNEFNNGQSMLNTDILDEYTLLWVRAQGDFIIEDADGNYLRMHDCEITDKIGIYKYNFIVSGDNTPCDYLFIVPKSDNYKCITSDCGIELFYSINDCSIYGTSVYDGKYSQISSMIINNSGNVTVNCKATK